MKEIPRGLRKYLAAEDLLDIEQAIEQAEKGTSGEIIPMIVRISSATGHVIMSLFCMLTALFFISGLAEWQSLLLGSNPLWLLADFVFCFAVAYGLSQFDGINRLLVSKRDQNIQVFARARLAFYEEGLQKTKGATGLLIFLSLMERRVVVLADKAIAAKYPVDTWENMVQMIVSAMKKKSLKSGLVSAILEGGRILGQSLPIQEGDENELRNHLIVRDF